MKRETTTMRSLRSAPVKQHPLTTARDSLCAATQTLCTKIKYIYADEYIYEDMDETQILGQPWK